MGAKNVGLAYAVWATKVPWTSFGLLVFMALRAKDGESPEYWGGHKELAMAVFGHREKPVTRQDLRQVRRHLTPLLEAGAVKLVHPPAPGRKARYRLELYD